MKKFKENQITYCCRCLYERNKKVYRVFSYLWHDRYKYCFDMELVFDNKKDAEEKAKQLNGE